jgi:hypothetical protein
MHWGLGQIDQISAGMQMLCFYLQLLGSAFSRSGYPSITALSISTCFSQKEMQLLLASFFCQLMALHTVTV